MRFLCAIAAFGLLAACAAETNDEQGGLIVPPELEALGDTANACFDDILFVPIEHSEHCVVFAETFLVERHEKCDGSRSYQCLEYKLARANIYFTYQSAINNSHLRFGISEEIQIADEKRKGYILYFDGELLRRLFEKCLRDEQEALGDAGLRRVHSTFPRFLEEGQMCIREGYPEFETSEI